MKAFWWATLIWLAICIILGIGILLAVKGSWWLLILGSVGLVFSIGKWGCLAQH